MDLKRDVYAKKTKKERGERERGERERDVLITLSHFMHYILFLNILIRNILIFIKTDKR